MRQSDVSIKKKHVPPDAKGYDVHRFPWINFFKSVFNSTPSILSSNVRGLIDSCTLNICHTQSLLPVLVLQRFDSAS